MAKTNSIETLITATVTGVVQDDEALFITARSLMGKYRSYMIAIVDGELTVTVSEGAEDEKKKKTK